MDDGCGGTDAINRVRMFSHDKSGICPPILISSDLSLEGVGPDRSHPLWQLIVCEVGTRFTGYPLGIASA